MTPEQSEILRVSLTSIRGREAVHLQQVAEIERGRARFIERTHDADFLLNLEAMRECVNGFHEFVKANSQGCAETCCNLAEFMEGLLNDAHQSD